MKKLIYGKIGTSYFEVHYIEQFEDVKVLTINPDGVETYTLPDSTIPKNLDTWQARPDPILKEGFVQLTQERPAKEGFIISKQGKWVPGVEVDVEQNIITKNELLSKAHQQILILQYAVDSGKATKQEKSLLQKWQDFILEVNRLDVNSNILWPEIPTT